MPGTRPGMTTDFTARGVLKRCCADGKTPLLAARLCNHRLACQNAGPAGKSRENPRSSLACASCAADPDPVAGADRRSRHRPLRLFAGAAGHARRARLVVFGRRFHEHHQCRGLPRRCLDGLKAHQAIRPVCRGALGDARLRSVAGAVCAVGKFCRSGHCTGAGGARGGGRFRRRRCAGGAIAQSHPARATFCSACFMPGRGSASWRRA